FDSPLKFDAFVDNVSKYRNDTSYNAKDALAVVMDTNFIPLNSKNNITISPYPNSEKLIKKKSVGDDPFENTDFILLLNNFKNDKNYLNTHQNDLETLIVTEIFKGLGALNKLDFPYANKKKYGGYEYSPEFNQVYVLDENSLVNYYLTSRKDDEAVKSMSTTNGNRCKKIMEFNTLPSIIHWKDQLISQGRDAFPQKKYKYKRVIALGDIHGDYDKLISILRHAKLINKKNNWIGTDAILVQI
ncbi:hypothetical protein PIROE2DRAFT_14881, partial [Piromyces sp. E2]